MTIKMNNINDFIIENNILKKYMGKDCEVVIPKGVTKIDSNAFDSCEDVTRVVIPESVESIETMAFFQCTGLSEIHIPNGVKTIG